MNKWIDEGVCVNVFSTHVYRCPFCDKHIIEEPGREPGWCPACGELVNAVKPRTIGGDYRTWHCGCGNVLEYKHDDICPQCRRKIDWENC